VYARDPLCARREKGRNFMLTTNHKPGPIAPGPRLLTGRRQMEMLFGGSPTPKRFGGLIWEAPA